MKEKQDKSKHKKKHHRKQKKEYKRRTSSSSSSSQSDEWVEKEVASKDKATERDDWMSMTGVFKTFTKEDIKSRREKEDKKHIDSYNPATSSRELNPYWKDGGSGVPQTPESFRKSNPFIKPADSDDYYSKSSYLKEYKNPTTSSSHSMTSKQKSGNREDKYYQSNKFDRDEHSQSYSKSYNWKKETQHDYTALDERPKQSSEKHSKEISNIMEEVKSNIKLKDSSYLSDEKMNKLAAKIVKAEIMGDMKLVEELKAKLDAAREYRKQNPDTSKEGSDNAIMLMTTNNMGNSRPLTKNVHLDSKGDRKRKSETHEAGQRNKYFHNDDKYNLSQMFQQEKYGTNYEDDAQLAKIASKHKNINDDLEDIFVDEISKTTNAAKESEKEKQRAIQQHVKMERSLEGCEYCVDSKNMVKHLMVSCGNKVYLALPVRKSLVKGHCVLSTVQHFTCVTSLDEDIWEEILNYRKALTQFFNSQDQDVLFFETATKLHKYPHMVINCIPMPRDAGDAAAIYFKKALLECETEWSMNKKVVELKGKGIRKGIPKGLPYFWVDFGMDPGFAHVIEDQNLFPKNFAEEIIGGILDLDHYLWKNPKKEYGEQQRKKVLEFVKEWKPYDTVGKI